MIWMASQHGTQSREWQMMLAVEQEHICKKAFSQSKEKISSCENGKLENGIQCHSDLTRSAFQIDNWCIMEAEDWKEWTVKRCLELFWHGNAR